MIGIIDLGLGNVGSIQNMCTRAGIEAALVREPAAVASSSKLILPGVGDFGHGMRSLHASGLLPVLEQRVLVEKVPLMGICLGMQMLTRGSEEAQEPGLGWIEADTVRLSVEHAGLRVPHMGWNEIAARKGSTLFADLPDESRFYFVHTYEVVCDRPDDVAATAFYGKPVTAAICRDNISGTQFHPEKSHRFGLALFRSFASLC